MQEQIRESRTSIDSKQGRVGSVINVLGAQEEFGPAAGLPLLAVFTVVRSWFWEFDANFS